MRAFDPGPVRALLETGVAERAFPAAVVEVGTSSDVVWACAFGRLTYAPDAPETQRDTIFDLASLTKVMATVPILTRARIDVDAPVRTLSPAWRGEDRAAVTVRQLLDHSSGLPAHDRLWQRMHGREAIEAAISAAALDRPPGTAAVYSDLGFILLGLILERLGGARLDAQFEPIARACGPTLGFSPPAAWRERIAPTEFDPWRGRLLRGEVHDENAAVLEGMAGHAGLFGTAAEVGAFARLALATFRTPTVLGAPKTVREFAARSTVPGSSRALGWDTMLPTSSCGTRMSASAIGHTGFTGTSLWLDVDRDLYVVLLTNRVHPTRDNVRLRALRPRIHDAIVDALET